MGNSRNKKGSENKMSANGDFATPHSPAEKVKNREREVPQDPLYYHPDAHPFFNHKRFQLKTRLINSHLHTDPLLEDGLSDINPTETKATL